MNILIDTHILLWALCDPKKLKSAERKILLSTDTMIYVSIISLWEISLKYSLGKLELKPTDIQKIPNAILASGYNIITLSPEDASGFYTLPRLQNQDPFDRMLIWQAINNDYCFLTRDKHIPEYINAGLKLI